MAAFNFPNSPSTNDIHTENGVSWKWNGTVWKKIASPDTLAKANSKVQVVDAGTGGYITAETDGTQRLRVQNSGAIVTGILTSTTFVGALTGNVTGNVSGTSAGLTGTPAITVGAVTASTGQFSGNVNILGTLTYEDVKNIDSVGIITARDDIKLTATEGKVEATGATGLTLNASHGSAYARIRTAGSERLRITSDGYVRIGGNEGNYQLVVIDESNRTNTAETQLNLYAKHDGSGNTGVGFGGGIRFWGDRNGDNAEQNMGRIMCIADVNSGTNISGALTFDTASAGSSSEKMRISSSGLIWAKTRSAEVRRMILSGSPSNASFNIEAHDGESGTSSGDVQGKLGLFYNDGTTLTNTACISFERGSGAPDGAMAFVTNQAERLRIHADDGQINLGGNFTQTAHKVCIQGGTSSQLLVRGQEADIWLNSTGGSETKWRILGSTGGSTHRFRIYDQTNSTDVIEIYGQDAGNENKTENSDVHINYGLMVGKNRTRYSTGYGCNGVYAPVVSGGEGECVFSIDPSWSKSELRKFFNSDGVSWLNIGDAPGGYAIMVSGQINVGGDYGSGFPYIPIDDGDSFRMECWIRTHNGSQNHYMGSIEYDCNMENGTGNPGSYGYWCMVNQTINSTSWTRVTGTIGPNHGGSYGEFRSGFTGGARKYWTPQALFNYVNSSGDRICYISGWRVFRLRHRGTHYFDAISKGSGSFKIDHPLPTKKDTHYLQHSFIEGPKADLIYRGKTTLVAGISTVNIDTEANMTDGTFVALNTDVQCHTTNETGWTATKGAVSGNKLTITAQDNACTDTISWMVIGERQDEHIKEKDTDWTDDDGKVIVELPKAQNVPEGGDIPMVAPVGIVNSKPNT